jgi:hypothetical protein
MLDNQGPAGGHWVLEKIVRLTMMAVIGGDHCVVGPIVSGKREAC